MDLILELISLVLMGTISYYRFYNLTNLNRNELGLDEMSLKDFNSFLRVKENKIRQFYWVPLFAMCSKNKSQKLKTKVNILTIMLYILLIYLIGVGMIGAK